MAPVALKITMKCTVRTAESVCLKKKVEAVYSEHVNNPL